MRITINLPTSKESQLKGIPNRSAYFTQLLEDRRSDAYEALLLLREAGWNAADVESARAALTYEPTEIASTCDGRYLEVALLAAVRPEVAATVKTSPMIVWALVLVLRESALNGHFFAVIGEVLA